MDVGVTALANYSRFLTFCAAGRLRLCRHPRQHSWAQPRHWRDPRHPPPLQGSVSFLRRSLYSFRKKNGPFAKCVCGMEYLCTVPLNNSTHPMPFAGAYDQLQPISPLFFCPKNLSLEGVVREMSGFLGRDISRQNLPWHSFALPHLPKVHSTSTFLTALAVLAPTRAPTATSSDIMPIINGAWRAETTVAPETVLLRLEYLTHMVVVDMLARGRPLVVPLPTADVALDSNGVLVHPASDQHPPRLLVGNSRAMADVLLLAASVYTLVATRTRRTLRDVFYDHVGDMESQRRIDQAAVLLSLLIGVRREHLNLVCLKAHFSPGAAEEEQASRCFLLILTVTLFSSSPMSARSCRRRGDLWLATWWSALAMASWTTCCWAMAWPALHRQSPATTSCAAAAPNSFWWSRRKPHSRSGRGWCNLSFSSLVDPFLLNIPKTPSNSWKTTYQQRCAQS